MRRMKRPMLGLAVVIIGACLFVAFNIWAALDWDRRHTRTTADLPFYESGMPDGLYQLRANGLIFRTRIFGSANKGAGIIMLHGHPETSIMWQALANKAADQGYKVVAFDQRGYSPGARPEGVKAYETDNQVSDVIAVADEVGFDEFHLVGHDWGSVVAWTTTIFYPKRVSSLTAMSIPHPQTLRTKVVDDTPAYVRLFALPWVPETMLLFNNLSGYRDTYSEQSKEEIAEYLRVFSEPGASTATLNWYRAIEESLRLLDTHNPKICIPTLFIYGDTEFWVTEQYLEQQRKLVSPRYSELKLKAGHWLVQKHLETIADAVLSQINAAEEIRGSEPQPSCKRRFVDCSLYFSNSSPRRFHRGDLYE